MDAGIWIGALIGVVIGALISGVVLWIVGKLKLGLTVDGFGGAVWPPWPLRPSTGC